MKKSLGVIVKAKNDIKKEDFEEHIPAELMSMSKWDMMKYSKPRERLFKASNLFKSSWCLDGCLPRPSFHKFSLPKL